MDGYTNERCPLPPSDYFSKERENFKNILDIFLRWSEVSHIYITVDSDLIDQISLRVFQRINYYQFFHGIDLHQSRQVAFKSYWMLRYRPLRLKSKNFWNNIYDINVYFAFFIMVAQALAELVGNCSREIRTTVANNILLKHGSDYIRAFSEYDISKEAMMMISEGFKSIVKCELNDCNLLQQRS
jgi:hypothetical protein